MQNNENNENTISIEPAVFNYNVNHLSIYEDYKFEDYVVDVRNNGLKDAWSRICNYFLLGGRKMDFYVYLILGNFMKQV